MVAPSGRWPMIEVPAVRQSRFEGTRLEGVRFEEARIERRTPSAQPQDLLPWADPYIAGLVYKLKAEIIAEQIVAEEIDREAQRRGHNRLPLDAVYEAVYDGVMGELMGGVYQELDPPLPSQDPGFDFPDRDSWPNPGEIL